jgi:two-component system sensor histidine kinase HydH
MAAPAFHELQNREMSRAFAAIMRLRLVMASIMSVVLLGLGLWDGALWRIVALSATISLIMTLSIFEFLRFHRSGFGDWSFAFNLWFMAMAQGGMLFATGGLESPLVGGVLLLVIASSLFVARKWMLFLTIGQAVLNVVVNGILTVSGVVPIDSVPKVFGGHPMHSNVWVLTTMTTLLIMIGALTAGGTAVRRLFDAMVLEAVEAREATLATWTAQNRELTALAAEIAHELKNPLASVKGLSALMATDAQGRDAERLAVLRGEVERMQTILEGFLNFSRPLVPVDAADVNLVALLQDIALLHEGTARDRGVTVRVDGHDVHARCDARKIKQVVINLVQNALDAAPEGSVVGLSAADGDVVTLEVRDTGPGVEPAIQGRLFEPGVTTRPHGSGLGLVIARALARQHGGDLAIESGGATVARVTLPRGGP